MYRFGSRRAAARLFAACAFVFVAGAAAPLMAADAVPDFYRNNTPWRLLGGSYGGKNFQPPPPGAPGVAGPIGDHPDYPHTCNMCGGQPNLRIGDDTHPLLLPWAAAQMKKTREDILAGAIPFDPAARCWMPGVPSIISYPIEPLFIHQTRDEVIFLYQRQHIARHIYLNRPHSQNLKPSWHGESIGWYEGDTLVVDTIGLNDKSFVEVFNVPHTEQLHVIERYRILENGQLQVIITVDDPGTFREIWSAQKIHGAFPDDLWEETVCQDGVLNDRTPGLPPQLPVPSDETPDF